jgi:DNA uptake protein ComE-like DNA-binding protein
MEFSRKITASEKGVAGTFEVAAFNRFKGTIAKAIQSNATEYLDALMKNPQGLPKELNRALEKALVEEFTKQQLLELFPNVSASKTLNQAVEDVILDILKTGKSSPYSANKKLKNLNAVVQKTSIKLPKIEVKAPRVRVNPSVRNTKGQFTSLTSIQNLINSKLAQQIQKNMGKGNAKAILNYRTGRFANSVKVERLSMDRQGGITSFYSYMKNPYQIFEPGFRQGSPQSRDPRLVIGKSIREIAAQAVSARMKAISV